jgi:hypothetical protein
MANTDKKSADAKATQQRKESPGQRKTEDQPRPSGDSPKPHGDPMQHLLKDEK